MSAAPVTGLTPALQAWNVRDALPEVDQKEDFSFSLDTPPSEPMEEVVASRDLVHRKRRIEEPPAAPQLNPRPAPEFKMPHIAKKRDIKAASPSQQIEAAREEQAPRSMLAFMASLNQQPE
jgi:hypothetical protein